MLKQHQKGKIAAIAYLPPSVFLCYSGNDTSVTLRSEDPFQME